jgi:hypothetical protein
MGCSGPFHAGGRVQVVVQANFIHAIADKPIIHAIADRVSQDVRCVHVR